MATASLQEQPNEDQLGPSGFTTHVVNKQGLKLQTYFYPATAPAKAVLLLVHGHGSYLFREYLVNAGPGKRCLYKGSWVEVLNRKGYSVCGLDLQGHGFSESLYGRRCYIEKFDDHVDDVLQLAAGLKKMQMEGFDGLPMFLAGVSLGGCIAVTCMYHTDNLFQGVVLLAPMLSLNRVSSKGWNPYLRPISTLLSWIVPWLPLITTARNHMFPDMQAEWDADELCWHGKTRVRNAAEYLRVTEWLGTKMPEFTFPFLVFHSEKDTLTDPDGARNMYEWAQSKDKTLRVVTDMWHVLVKEPGNEKLLAEVVQWLDVHVKLA